jgi:hypothetical protein
LKLEGLWEESRVAVVTQSVTAVLAVSEVGIRELVVLSVSLVGVAEVVSDVV